MGENSKQVIESILNQAPDYIQKIKNDVKPNMKPFKCAVVSCSNCFDKHYMEKAERFYKFHKFPPASDLAKLWLEKCGLPEDTTPNTSMMVCSEHFNLDDYERNYKEEFSQPNYRRPLKNDAVPSLKLTGNPVEINVADLVASDVKMVEVEEVKFNVRRYRSKRFKPNTEVVPVVLKSDATGESVVSLKSHATKVTGVSFVSLKPDATGESVVSLKPDARGESVVSLKTETTRNKAGVEYVAYKLTAEQRARKLAFEDKEDKLKNILSSLRGEIKKVHGMLNYYNKQIEKMESKKTQSHRSSGLYRVFSDAQIAVLKGEKKVVWSDDDLAMAFTLRHMSNRECYLYLKYTLNMPLPALSCVQKWAAYKDD